ncbi:MAG: hypothetical protein M5R36_15660 [Deltaproteobacteria bacterium]|nr:hypothetical protein [Deltaproteobacteria bacterium]
MPTWGAYAAIKLAIGAVSEILHYEVRKHGVRVTTVYPFMVNTGFYDDVKADTFGQKWSMRLLPYYSMTPEKVGRMVFRAAERGKRVEMVHPFNYVGFYARFVPFLPGLISRVTDWLLSKGDADVREELKAAGAA